MKENLELSYRSKKRHESFLQSQQRQKDHGIEVVFIRKIATWKEHRTNHYVLRIANDSLLAPTTFKIPM